MKVMLKRKQSRKSTENSLSKQWTTQKMEYELNVQLKCVGKQKPNEKFGKHEQIHVLQTEKKDAGWCRLIWKGNWVTWLRKTTE